MRGLIEGVYGSGITAVSSRKGSQQMMEKMGLRVDEAGSKELAASSPICQWHTGHCNAWRSESATSDHVTSSSPAELFVTSASPSLHLLASSSPPQVPFAAPQMSRRSPTFAGRRHFDSRQSNVTRDVHNNLPVRPLFGRHALPGTHFTAYRTIWDS